MPISVRDGGSWKAATIYVRDGGSWKLATGYVRDGDAWKQFTSASADVTPDAVNWTNCEYSSAGPTVPTVAEASTVEQTITSISQAITLEFAIENFTDNNSASSLKIFKNGVLQAQPTVSANTTSLTTLSVAEDDVVYFTARSVRLSNTDWSSSYTVRVKNSSDGGVTLDTFTVLIDCAIV